MTGGTSAPLTARRSSGPSLETTSNLSGKDAVGRGSSTHRRISQNGVCKTFHPPVVTGMCKTSSL